MDDILEITMCWWIIGDRTIKLETTRQGSGVLLVFCLCRLGTDHCSSFLSCWTHALHLAGWIKYLLNAKLVAWFGLGPTRVRVLVLKGVWQGRKEWAQGVSKHSGGPWVLRLQFIPWRLPESCHWWPVAHFSGWVWFVWGINHQLVRNQFKSPSLLDSEHLTRVTAS
jgi:hypothetical protein